GPVWRPRRNMRLAGIRRAFTITPSPIAPDGPASVVQNPKMSLAGPSALELTAPLHILCSRTPASRALKNGRVSIKQREPERKVSGQGFLFVANVHVSFPRFGEAIPEQCGVQARGRSITCDIVRRKGAEALDEGRDRSLPA